MVKIFTFQYPVALKAYLSFFVIILFIAASVCRPEACRAEPRIHQEKERYVFTSPHMGTTFRIVLYAANDTLASAAADSAFQRVEQLNSILSDYLADSELNRLVQTAGSGKMVEVSEPLFFMLRKSRHISEQSGGAFDITMGPLIHLWREIHFADEPRLPGEEALREAMEAVGYEYVHLDEAGRRVMLEAPGMQLDLGGIAKGYAAGEVMHVLRHFGIDAALVDAGGDMVAGAAPPGREGWNIAVRAHDNQAGPQPFILALEHKAVSTSGDRYQFVEIDGVRYSHIIDPESGYGLTERRTVTAIGRDPVKVDAWSTALSVLPVAEGLELVEGIDGLAVFIEIYENGSVSQYESAGFRDLREHYERMPSGN